MANMTGITGLLSRVVEETIIQRDAPEQEKERYIHPSSLAKGCMLYVAMELMGRPKAVLEPRIKRILEVGTERHRRIASYLSPVTLAREVFFVDEEYKIRGYCDAIVYIPPERDQGLAGFYAVEIKTAGSNEFERIVDEGQPRDDHVRQCQIYLWGVDRYYQHAIPLRGGIIFYENRDTLEHHLFEVSYNEELMKSLLAQIERMWAGLKQGELPNDYLPLDHWGHRYCPYLEVCEVGQRAMVYQQEHRQPLPDKVLAEIIGTRIVRKQRREGKVKRDSKGRNLEELVAELKWD